jgi:hypothetical protein
MSLLRAILFASPIVAGGVVIACRSTTPGQKDPELLDCDWAQTSENCWKPFVAAVDKCLGQGDAAAPHDSQTGALSADRMSCTLANGTTIVGTERIDQPITDASDDAPRSFVVQTAGGTVCLRYDQGGSPEAGVQSTLVGPTGTLKWSNDGTTLTITCPSGNVVHGQNDTLLDCLLPGELPGYAYFNTESSAFFQLLGMSAPLYSCKVDAGGPTDAATDSGG